MELQGRQGEFRAKGAALFVLGSRPESMDMAKSKASSDGITYPILYDAQTNATRKVGLWSDRMGMPFMGYVIIDKSGRAAAGDQVLSEATGSASANIDLILADLARVQGTAGENGQKSGG